MLSTWKIAPALAAGCTVVHKPAEWSPAHRARCWPRSALEAGLPAGVLNVVHGFGEEAGRGADRASGHQGDRLRRRSRDRLGHHAPGRGNAEARAFRTRRQESGDRVRRCRYRPRARCLRVHDLLPERRALHVLEPRCWSRRPSTNEFAKRARRARQARSRSAIRSTPQPRSAR